MGDGFIPESGTLKMARFKETTVDGVAIVLLKIPGNFDPDKPGRVVARGRARWESASHVDDWVELHVVDHDDILNYGTDVVIATYTDVDVPEENRGWYMLGQDLSVEALAGMGRLPGQLYVQIIFHTGDGRTDTIRGNLEWGDTT